MSYFTVCRVTAAMNNALLTENKQTNQQLSLSRSKCSRYYLYRVSFVVIAVSIVRKTDHGEGGYEIGKNNDTSLTYQE